MTSSCADLFCASQIAWSAKVQWLRCFSVTSFAAFLEALLESGLASAVWNLLQVVGAVYFVKNKKVLCIGGVLFGLGSRPARSNNVVSFQPAGYV